MASQEQEHQREDDQQDYVERQDIEVLRLILQQQRLDDRDIGLVDKIIDAEVFVIVLMLHVEGCVKYQRSKDHKQEDVCDVELPNPAIDLGRGDDGTAPLESLSVNHGGGVARNKDEHLSGVAKRERLQRQIREDIIRNVVDEDENQRQTAKQIKPEIAPAPLMGITAVARALRVSVHRKNIAMCMAHTCKAHGRPEPSINFAPHAFTCISVLCLAHIIGGPFD